MSHELKAKYSARALAREWGWFTGKDKAPDHKKVIRDLATMRIRQHRGENGKGLWFWTRDIQKHAPQMYEWWKEKRHAAEMTKIARGEAA
jgi:hypothetical protein